MLAQESRDLRMNAAEKKAAAFIRRSRLSWASTRSAAPSLGVDTKTISFGGGEGGAGADYVTARATVQLLQAMAKRPEYKAYEAALPVLGMDERPRRRTWSGPTARHKAR